MAKKRRTTNSNRGQDDLSRDDFGPSPEEHPDAKAFTGYLRPTSDAKGWRLYLSLDFNDYLEIPQSALIGQRTLASRANPLAGDVVWVRGGAVLRRVSITVREAQAEFLRGEIVAQNLAATPMLAIPSPAGQPTLGTTEWTMCRPCLSNQPNCPTPTQGCNRPTLPCPTLLGCPKPSFSC